MSFARRNRPSPLWFATAVLAALPAQAGSVSKMVIITPAQTLSVGACSAVTTVQAQDGSSNPASVPSNTTVFLSGGNGALAFFSDSACSKSVSSVTMLAGTNSVNFYFKGLNAGSFRLLVSTYAYTDYRQTETIVSGPAPSPSPSPSVSVSPSPSPSPSPSASSSPSPSPSPSATSSGGGIAGRSVPAPIYGVTFDEVSNMSDEIVSLKTMPHFPTTRIVFDKGVAASNYLAPIQQLHPNSYTMGELIDSSYMKNYDASSASAWATQYTQTLGNLVDIWEVGNEVNGNWLGSNVVPIIEAMYDVVSSQNGKTAITFFYEGEPSDPLNCISTQSGGNDMFTWINDTFQLNLAPSQRNPETEKIRLNLNYALISWYPSQCNNLQPNWAWVYTKLAGIFPNAKVGFGELGTPRPQSSQYEIDLINQYYPMASTTSGLPASYVGGYFWWYFAEEMVPASTSTLLPVLDAAIK